jgi:hypothetical protein
VIYLDTSALVKLVWVEDGSAELVAWLNQRPDAPLVSSALAELELRRAVWRVDPTAMTEAESVLAELTLLPIDAGVLRAAGGFRYPYLRALDAIHLSTARQAQGLADVTEFVSFDKRLLESASSEGFTVAAPGG